MIVHKTIAESAGGGRPLDSGDVLKGSLELGEMIDRKLSHVFELIGWIIPIVEGRIQDAQTSKRLKDWHEKNKSS